MMKTAKSFTDVKDAIFIDTFKEPVLVEIRKGQIHRVRPFKKSLVGNIYLGRVDYHVKSLGAYFLDLGQGQKGFLQEDLNLSKGDLVLVQVAKDAYSKKHPGLKTDLSIGGENLVYFPKGKKFYYSLKNKKYLKNKWKEAKHQLPPGGWLIRTGALDIERALKEAQTLYALGQDLLKEEKLSPKAKCLYQKNRLKTDLPIFTNDSDLAQEMGWTYSPDSLYHQESYRKALEELGKEQVPLAKGGLIRIEKTAALTAIDVDSHGASQEDLKPEEVNLLAAEKASQQILRRDIRGMVVIDFISCGEENRKAIQEAMEKTLKEDPLTILYGFSAMGVYELVRKRKEK